MKTLIYGSGLTRRFGAWVVDTAIIAIPLAAILAATTERPFSLKTFMIVAASPLTFLLMWPYFAIMESSKHQATVGKLVCRLRVVDIAGNRISFGRATGRYFARALSATLGMLGVAMILFTKLNQSLHDMMTNTVIIESELFLTLKKNRIPQPSDPAERRSAWPARGSACARAPVEPVAGAANLPGEQPAKTPLARKNSGSARRSTDIG